MARTEDRGAPHEVSDAPGAASELPGGGCVDAASWLGDDALVLVGWFRGESTGQFEGWLVDQTRLVALDIQFVESYARPDVAGSDPSMGKIVIVGAPDLRDRRQVLGQVVIRSGASTFSLNPPDISTVLQDLDVLVNKQLGGLEPAARSGVREALVSALGAKLLVSGDPTLEQMQRAVHDALQDRHSTRGAGDDAAADPALDVETMVAIDETSFYVRGWILEDVTIHRLTAISSAGGRVDLLPGVFRHRRGFHDRTEVVEDSTRVAKPGFVSFFELESHSRHSDGWILQAETATGRICRATAPPVVRDLYAARDVVLDSLKYEQPWADELKRNHVSPAINRLQQRYGRLANVDCSLQFGAAPATPDVSIIVPLFRRIDLLEHQMASLAHDPQIHDVQLVYVLDSPELADRLRVLAGEIFQIYRVPFKVVFLENNLGYPSANNIGVEHSSGRMVLLLNSDVFPETPGWLRKMTAFYDARPDIGALGAKLLYEDDSLQHAGMFFFQWPSSGVWDSMHYFAGHDRNLPDANVTRPVPAVTGACLMILRTLYEQVGGLSPDYVRGGYEDVELCLRLSEAGRENWYLPEVELYHLEAQSYAFSRAPSSSLRELATHYNRWLLSTRWSERIEQVMARCTAAPTPGTA